MHDLDPASLLCIPTDRGASIYPSPTLFDCVGEGVSSNLCNISKPGSPLTPSREQCPISLTRTLDPSLQDYKHQHREDGESTECDTAYRNCLDPRLQCIERINVFDLLAANKDAAQPLSDDGLSSSPFGINSLTPPSMSEKYEARTFEVSLHTGRTHDTFTHVPIRIES